MKKDISKNVASFFAKKYGRQIEALEKLRAEVNANRYKGPYKEYLEVTRRCKEIRHEIENLSKQLNQEIIVAKALESVLPPGFQDVIPMILDYAQENKITNGFRT